MNSCARCGDKLSPQRVEGLCTRCLLESGLDLPTVDRPGSHLPVTSLILDPSTNSQRSPKPDAVRYFGDYELFEEVARGGMGVVYRARQLSLGRTVAVKMILAGQFASKQMIQRFRGEVTAAALLQHPNIVAIHDVGILDDQHYFSMDYVEGQNLSQLVGNRPLPPAKAARYLKLIAEAIHYAHGQGILHRDLKPSNILIDSATDQPRITDFGLAKRLDGESSLTSTGQVLGSPNFMPPEQAGSGPGKVGRHSDVYGLGAILYYLLTARPPFQANSLEGIVTQVLQTEPLAPRDLNPSVPRDLDTICLKCLSKEPPKRYATTAELADELGRFLKDEPIRARPVGRIEKAWRRCRRNPVVASLSTATALLLLAVAIGSPIAAFRIGREKVRADQNLERADQNLYDSDMNLAQHAWDDGDLGYTLSRLQAHWPRPGELDRRGFEWFYFWKLCEGDQRTILRGHGQPVNCVAISPNGSRVATGSVGNPVHIWDTATGNLIRTLPEQNVISLAFAPDGQMLGVGGQDQMVVWNIETGQAVFKREEAFGRFRLAFSRRGNLLVVGKEGGLRWVHGGTAELLDYVTGESKHVFPESGGHVAISANGEKLATRNWNQTAKIWDLATGQLVRCLKTARLVAMALSPDGQTLATSDGDSEIALWDVPRGQKTGWLTNNQHNVWSLAFSPDGKSLATGGADQMIRLWDVATREQTEQFQGHGGEVMSVAFSADGQTLASGSTDTTAMLWDAHPHRVLTTVSNVTSRPVFSPDGRFIAAGMDEGVAVWDAATFQKKAFFTGAFDPVAFSADGNALVTRGTNYFLKTFNIITRTARETILRGPVAEIDSHAALSPDGQTLAVGFANGALMFADARTGALITNVANAYLTNIFQIAFSPNGKFLATAGREMEAGRVRGARIWDVATHQLVVVLAGHADIVLSLAFSPDGKILATSSVDHSVKFWDTDTWKELSPSLRQMEVITSVAYSPSGRTLATACEDGKMKFWSVATHRELASLKLGVNVQYMTFSPDGQTLAAHDWGDSLLRLWRAPGTQKERR